MTPRTFLVVFAIAAVGGAIGAIAGAHLEDHRRSQDPELVATRADVERVIDESLDTNPSARDGEVSTADVATVIARLEENDWLRRQLLAEPEIIIEAINVMRETQAADAGPDRVPEQAASLMADPTHASVLGEIDAPQVVQVFHDFNCPHCRRFIPEVLEAFDQREDLAVWFRELPVIRRESVPVAHVATALARQGLYRDFAVMAGERSGILDEAGALAVAREIGADMDALDDALLSESVKDAVDANLDLADRIGVRGTPAMVVDERIVAGFVPADRLLELIDAGE